jgi:hypothetical protein
LIVKPAALAASIALCALPLAAGAQGDRNAVCPGFTPYANIEYDGRFAFLRLDYGANNQGIGTNSRFSRRGERSGYGGWAHDYPTAECHFNKLLSNLSTTRTRHDGSVILRLEDPELFKFPIAYLSEPGFWYPSEAAVQNLRKYLQKGGFVIFDDFEGEHIYNLAEQMQRVLPGMRLYKLDEKHTIFDTFYRVKSIEMYHPTERTPSTFYGIFEDNDPKKRMLAIANHNNDIGDYWEWSDTQRFGIDPSNEAYKLGINYIIYILTR